MDEFGQYTGGYSKGGDWWNGTVGVLSGLWSTASKNKANQNIAKTNADALTSVAKFFGICVVVGFLIKKFI